MSIADKLNYLYTTKKEIADAIESKGQEANVSDRFRDYPDKIRAIITQDNEPITITENGSYTAPENKGYSPVTVNVASEPPIQPTLISREITENGTYNASEDGADGYASVTVNVAGGGGGGTHTVVFKNDDGSTLQTVTGVPDYGYAEYTGAIPTRSDGDPEYYFMGWNPPPANVTSDLTCIAQYTNKHWDATEITDSWSEICANRGANYDIGAYKLLEIGTVNGVNYGSVRMQKITTGESGTVSTWVARDLLVARHRMNPSNTTVGGWKNCEMRSWLNDTVLPLLHPALKGAIQPVTKWSRTYDGQLYWQDEATSDRLWIPSRQEVFGSSTTYETQGMWYQGIFYDANSRKRGNLNSSAVVWWLRSVCGTSSFRYVSPNGNEDDGYASNALGVVLGFCL